jgi:hypothetical protein
MAHLEPTDLLEFITGGGPVLSNGHYRDNVIVELSGVIGS